ncbi:flavin monoamine oxidase family protein [Bacillus sp. T33-2]|uniref:flavin monoamine oxidase family protein n=1 Tax=Bacillus sp. T33-2 TaxID=2054168 RepID=UPI000C77E26E|nr:NAD(P)/FAD-dependent oxidoreductase [Bacillus sp. T33-2]PLR91148.1 monoamine oxidase [Bacillus sp. T33-2]
MYNNKTFLNVDAETNRNAPRVAIIGGGLAGLTCAYRLQQSGIRSEVYEAAQRPGGRCWTKRDAFKDGQHIERGGELIDSNHEDIINLINELGLELDDLLASEKPASKPYYYINNSHVPCEDIEKFFRDVSEKINKEHSLSGFPILYHNYTKRAWELDHQSIVDWINENISGGIESDLGRLLCIAYTIEYGVDCSEQSALNLINLMCGMERNHFLMFGSSDERYRVKGGNDYIVQRLVEQLPNSIHFNHELISIKRNDDETYSLKFNIKDGIKEVPAEKIVLTVPFSVLGRTVDYSEAGFRPLKIRAIQELGMGCNIKAHYQFNSRHWEQAGCNGVTYNQNYQCTFESSRAQPGESGVIVHYTGGNEAVGMMKKGFKKFSGEFLDEFENVFPGIQNVFSGKTSVDYWITSKWARGSYSFRRIGQYTAFSGVEMEQEGNCHFAGEHTSVYFQGYMNGAVESGNRAAREIIDDFGH